MGTSQDAGSEDKKHCFVVMGFGIKTDLATGRKLNLDKSYQALIKPVVESKGIICVRADEIKHSGTIDVPMFQQLLTADLVVADLSTANVNAFYELGVRHALRPHTTIIMSEEQLSYPFDINHITINKYTHLGDSIDYFEVLRFQKLLGDTIDAVLNDDKPDSPVYTFLDGLIPPALQDKAEQVGKQVGEALSNGQPKTEEENPDNPTLALIIKQAEVSIKNKQFDVAKSLFMTALMAANGNPDQKVITNNSYLVQRLAYATYKSKLPEEVSALQEAIGLLAKIDLDHTNDSETVSLAGAIEKRLFEQGLGVLHLGAAIIYYLRGYFLLHNRYNGINLAYLLTCRADTSLDPTTDDKIADLVWANRIRLDVISMCELDWNSITNRKSQVSNEVLQNDDISESQEESETEQQFWILINKAEAYFGLGEIDEHEKVKQQALALKHDDQMMEGFNQHVKILAELQNKYGHILKQDVV